jgi:hypothetical protein
MTVREAEMYAELLNAIGIRAVIANKLEALAVAVPAREYPANLIDTLSL